VSHKRLSCVLGSFCRGCHLWKLVCAVVLAAVIVEPSLMQLLHCVVKMLDLCCGSSTAQQQLVFFSVPMMRGVIAVTEAVVRQ
jgi:hypothetical protein